MGFPVNIYMIPNILYMVWWSYFASWTPRISQAFHIEIVSILQIQE